MRRICRRRKGTSGERFALHFLWRTKVYHKPNRNSKYDASKEIRPGPPESHDVHGENVCKCSTCKHGSNSGRNAGRLIIHYWSISSDQGRKAWRGKIWDDANEAKLRRLFEKVHASYRRLILHAKNTGSWMIVLGPMVTSKVLAAKQSRNFCSIVMTLPPITLKKYVTAGLNNFPYIVELSAAKKESSLKITMKCMASSSALFGKTSHIIAYS